MYVFLRVSVRFLLDEFDGRGDGGEREWPPSPLRLFQALVNSAARLGMAAFAPSLEHLEKLPPPFIIASKPAAIQPRRGFPMFIPNNTGDLVAKSWSAGRENDIANYRAAKEIYPTRLPENAAAHYLWQLTDPAPHGLVDHIQRLARAISSFGWGINMVVADADTVETNVSSDTSADSEKWFPSKADGGISLRVPVGGTLAALEERHQAFLARLPTAPDGVQYFQPVPPLESFRIVTYRRESDLARPPYAVFALRELDDSKFAAFDPQWRRLHLAGMLRHTASRDDFVKALGWDTDKVNSFVLGHDKSDPNAPKPTTNAPRLVFIPLPSIERRGEDRGHAIGAIRRVLVTVSGPCASDEFQRIVRALEGRELIDEKLRRPIAFLRRQSENDNAVAGYFSARAASAVWATVTPVVLPGHDDPRKLRRRLSDINAPLSADEKAQIVRKLDERIERLLRKAFLDAGLSPQLVADADIQWRSSGFLPGVDLASRYSVPDQCRRFRRLHVRVIWREQASDGQWTPKTISGPLCVGSGRFFGLGLFAPVE
jgi:CRISPR-associated protein Csb2